MTDFVFYSVAALGVAYLLFQLFLKWEKNYVFNRFYLLGSLFLCLTSPLMEIDPGFMETRIPKMDIEQVLASSGEVVEEPVSSSTIVKLEKERSVFLPILLGLYSVISTILLFRFFRNLLNLRGLIRRNKKMAVDGLTVIPVEEKGNPFSFFNYLFINEEEFADKGYSTCILEHEAAHAKQLHSADIVLLEILLCFFWFNPFLWLYKKALLTTHEYLADAAVIASGASLEDYSRQLILAGNKVRQLQFISGFNLTQTKNRITMLYSKKSPRSIRAIKMFSALALLAVVVSFSSFTGSTDNSPFVVVVDVGHGGQDNGNLDEKRINLQISRQLEALSKDGEVKIILTRDKDDFISLADRADFIKAQKADMLLSLHCNASGDPSRSGLEAFVSRENEMYDRSFEFSEILVKQQLEEISEKAEIKEANFRILKDSPIPAVLLELGFLTNDKERARLQDPGHQKRLAENLYESLLLIRKQR